MTYKVQIKVMPLKDLLDPQGKAVLGGLKNLSISSIDDVRVGRHIELSVSADSEAIAIKTVTEAAGKLLANPVMEYFEIVSVSAL